MKLTKIYLIILYQIIELLNEVKSDHVQIVGCSKQLQCMKNLNRHLLEIIEENLDSKIQPCEHFWNYACGSWTSAPYYDHVDNFGAMANYYADNLIKTLRQLQENETEMGNLVEQIMKYFTACQALPKYKLNLAFYLKELPIQEIFGKNFSWYYFLEAVNWQDFDWLRAIAVLRRYGFKELYLQEYVGFAWHNAQYYTVKLKIPTPQIDFENKYKVLQIMDKFDLIWDVNNTKIYFNLANEIVKFDNKLQELNMIYQNARNKYEIFLHNLPSLFGGIDWYFYFEKLTNKTLPAETPVEFYGDFNYFKDLEKLLQQTPKQILGSYTLLKFGKYLMEILPVISERDCMLHTNVMFPVGIEYIYDKFLYKTGNEDQKVLQYIFSTLKQEFAEILKENKFQLDQLQSSYVENKLNLMQLKIGNLPLSLNDSFVNHYYSGIELQKYNFYHNHLEMLKFRTWQQHQPFLISTLPKVKLDRYYVNDDISQLRTAPYFIHKRNMIIVPKIFLQLPFYHYAQHPVLQFSLVGWILAHELSHAFDSHGLRLDGWGNENLVGLTLSEIWPYKYTLSCLVGRLNAVSLNERMADVNGLQLAFQTFFHYSNSSDRESSLKKLFFMNFAQFFCGSLPRAIGHDRDDVRVRQAIGNMKEFAQVFQCSAGAKENPPRKCNIWRSG